MDEAQTFPTLSPAEILGCMQDLSISCTQEDILKPTASRIWPIYEHFLEHLLGVPAENSFTHFSIMEILEHPALHQESLALMGFYQKLLMLFSGIGIEGFCFQDFLNPDKNRVRYILSGLINFTKFRQGRLQLFAQCTQKGEEYLETRESLYSKKNSLTERVNGIRAKRLEEEPLVQDYRKITLDLASENRELKKFMSRIESENANLSKQETDLSDKLKNSLVLSNNLKQDCTRLSSKIVRNPEKLKLAIADMHKSLKEDKATVTASEKKSRELHSKMDMMAMVEEDIQTCIDSMQACENERKKSETAFKKLETERDVCEAKKMELKEKEIREHQLKRQLINSTEKLTRLDKHQESKQAINQTKLNQLKSDFDAVSQERILAQTKVDENDKLSASIEKKIHDLKKQMENENADLNSDYEKLKSALESYQLNLETVMNQSSFV